MAAPSNNVGKIFVGGLAPQTTTEGLKAFFGAYGPITEAKVMFTTDEMTGMLRSRGFGFVVFSDPSVISEVLAQRRVTIDEKSVEVKAIEEGPGGKGKGGGDAKKCFLGGLPETADQPKVLEYFQKYDPAVEVKVLVDPMGKSRGFGYVNFTSDEAANSALADKDQHYIDGKWVDLKISDAGKGKGKGKGFGKGMGMGKGFGKGFGGAYGGGYGMGAYGGAAGYGYGQPAYGGAAYGAQAAYGAAPAYGGYAQAPPAYGAAAYGGQQMVAAAYPQAQPQYAAAAYGGAVDPNAYAAAYGAPRPAPY